MKKYVNDRKLNIESVYFGGGTPTAVNNEEFEIVMKEAYEAFVKDKNVKGRAQRIYRYTECNFVSRSCFIAY